MSAPAEPGRGYRDEPDGFLAELGARLEAGEEVDWDACEREHPALSAELARLRTGWAALDSLLRGFGMDGRRPAFEEDPHPAALEAARTFERRREKDARYERREPIARGGQAELHRAWDEDLLRPVAMKVCREDGAVALADPASGLARLLAEARITGQLTHPGIVPVHDIGLDERGRAWFTMELVEGRTLDAVLELARCRREGWSPTRALEVLLKVCDAVGYAHSKGVLHRDLKPANVMVGRFGEVRVMDWGLARVVGRSEEAAPVRTLSEEHSGASGSSALLTEEGDVVGTPAYMSPEQAEGRLEELDARTDVYALGAMLYELLAGCAPHARGGADRAEVLRRLRAGPPPPLARVAPEAPPELTAICERAMAREPRERYADMGAVAEDLRRYLEGRTVRAHRTGAWIELRKWIARNRALSGSLAAAALAIALGGLLYLRAERRRAEQLAQLVLAQRLAVLEAEAEKLWPAFPRHVPRLEEWIARTERALAELPEIERERERLRARAASVEPAAAPPDDPEVLELGMLRAQRHALEQGWAELAARAGVPRDPAWDDATWLREVTTRIARLEEELADRRRYRFARSDDQYRYEQLGLLLERGARLAAPGGGALAAVRARLEAARALAGRSVDDPRWPATIEAIAASPLYHGLCIAPQMGLVPLGPDPISGLFEFADVQTGAPPHRGADGQLVLDDGSSLVLVLIPRGLFVMGSLPPLLSWVPGPFMDARIRRSEFPPRPVVLEPFFLSKYELTQGQWLRVRGENPARNQPGRITENARPNSLQNPVERVSWRECRETVRRLGMRLPTEAQWEYAARAGTATTRWTGAWELTLQGAENLRDRSAAARSSDASPPEVQLLDDGWVTTAWVGSFRSNPWGLHDVLGNVAEWCEDVFVVDGRWPVRAKDGLRLHPAPFPERVVRGAGCTRTARLARSAQREALLPDHIDAALGLRPARAIE